MIRISSMESPEILLSVDLFIHDDGDPVIQAHVHPILAWKPLG
jgi:hypothetical protein